MNWRRFLLASIVALLLWAVIEKVEAHHRGRFLPSLPTAVQQRVLSRGYITYAFDQGTASYPGFREQARQVAEAGLKEVGLPAYEVSTGADVWLTFPPDQQFIAVCGNAAACFNPYADPLLIFFRRALLYVNWRTAIAHEGLNYGHTLGEHEQYDDINFTCLPDRIWTVMSCTTGVWYPQPFDTAIVLDLIVPDRPQGISLSVSGLTATVRWGAQRADGGLNRYTASNDTAQRVAFGWSYNRDSYITWIGHYAVDYCGDGSGACWGHTPYNLYERTFGDGWQGCLWLRAENEVAWWMGQRTPGDSWEGWWSLAGCW